jgi:lipid-binding SYLF domain-containing protein
MKQMRRHILAAFAAVALTALSFGPVFAAELEATAQQALKDLYRTKGGAKELGKKAVAVMVFPEVIKAGLLIGGQTGEGVLFNKGGRPAGRYRLTSASYGFQAGVQTYGYVLFFMTQAGLDYLNRTDGWEVGLGPSVVMVDKGFAKSTSSTTMRDDVYAVIFNQSGMMAGMGLQGSKISRVSGN